LRRGKKRGFCLTEILKDCTSSTLDCENAGDLEDDVYEQKSVKVPHRESEHTLGSAPAGHFAGEPYADNLRCLEFPRQIGHHVHGVLETS
jgi:hypothetical protein